MLAALIYLVLRRILALALLGCRSKEFKELEIVVLRHEEEKDEKGRNAC